VHRRFESDSFGRLGNDVEESDLFAESGLIEVSATTLEVALAFPHGDTFWRWGRSHGIE
jgi:hypothetical protein